tara:strand:- start:328 stop:468 length:141 start_codon:yes stop_codon:yes gene_type:complete
VEEEKEKQKEDVVVKEKLEERKKEKLEERKKENHISLVAEDKLYII